MNLFKTTLLTATLILLAATAGAAVVATDWLSVTTSTAQGNLNGITVDMSNMGSPGDDVLIGFYDLSTADFAPYALSATQETLHYAFDENWTASFAAPVTDLLLYCKFWRGPNQGPTDPPVFTYEFDRPFTILTGFGNASVVGNTLHVPNTVFQDGILEFTGTHTSLSQLSNNANNASRQALTFGLEEESVATERSTWSSLKSLY